jgi:CheY-like chemotaxis protein
MGSSTTCCRSRSATWRPHPRLLRAGLHVLCVEDNPVNLQLVRELLALRPAVRLRTAETGHAGIDAALAEPPDLLLLDLQLPDQHGMDVMRTLRASRPWRRCRIVALVGRRHARAHQRRAGGGL